MRRIGMLGLAVMTGFLTSGAGGAPDEPGQSGQTRFTEKALTEDFQQMREVLEQNHAALDEFTPKETLDSLMDRQFTFIRDSMAIHEFFVLLTPIIAKIGCGHTNLWMPMSYWDRKRDSMFPLRLRLLEDLVVVSGSYSGHDQVPRGSLILEINGRPVDEIISEMKASYTADVMNPHFIRKAVERRFPMIYARRFGFHEAYRVVYTRPCCTTPDILLLSPASNESVRAVVFKNFNAPDLRMAILNEKNTTVIRVETFIYYDRAAYFRNFIDSCFNVIDDRKIGTIIGTPSGATYKCNAGKNLRVDMKNTRIMLYFGRSTFAAAVRGMDKRKPIMPDVPVEETYRDFLDGRDAFMETALTLTR